MSDDKENLNTLEEYQKILQKRQGQGFRKLKVYFQELVRSGYIERRCNLIRFMNDIPENGYKTSIPDGAADFLDFIEIPKYWAKRQSEQDFWRLEGYIEELCQELGLYDDVWSNIIRNHLFFDKLPDLKHLDSELFQLCIVADESEERAHFNQIIEGIRKKKMRREIADWIVLDQERRAAYFPATLRISPYASKRDVLDFISRNFDDIRRIQEKYKSTEVAIGKVREKNQKVVERDDFIYENRHLSNKELVQLVSEKFGDILDEGNIGKIISIESERRLYSNKLRGKAVKEARRKEGLNTPPFRDNQRKKKA